MIDWQASRSSSWGVEAPEQEYWLSYADLMAGLLMVFALMLLAALYHYGRIVDEAGEVAGTRSEIIAALDSILRTDSSGVTVDPRTGAVKFPEGVLFEEGRATLQPAGMRQLDRFADKYFGILFRDQRIRGELRSVVIEGHTNDNASYEYNLDLSQRRAYSVMVYLLNNVPDYEPQLKEFVTASGRSFSQPICTDGRVHAYPCPTGKDVDKTRSRRIEILFRLRDEDLLERIRSLLLVE